MINLSIITNNYIIITINLFIIMSNQLIIIRDQIHDPIRQFWSLSVAGQIFFLVAVYLLQIP